MQIRAVWHNGLPPLIESQGKRCYTADKRARFALRMSAEKIILQNGNDRTRAAGLMKAPGIGGPAGRFFTGFEQRRT